MILISRPNINLILISRPKFWQSANVIETRLPDFHKIVITIIKTTLRKLKPKIINYRVYKIFSNDIFRGAILEK